MSAHPSHTMPGCKASVWGFPKKKIFFHFQSLRYQENRSGTERNQHF